MWYLLFVCAHGDKQKPTQNDEIIWLLKNYPKDKTCRITQNLWIIPVKSLRFFTLKSSM